MTLVGCPVKEQMGDKIKDVKNIKEWLVGKNSLKIYK